MNYRGVALITCLPILQMLAACGEDAAVVAARKAAAEAEASAKKDENSAKTAVLNSLKDPDSAKFGKISIVTLSSPSAKGSVKVGCVTVNARNTFGGYSGDQQATVANINDAWAVVNMDQRNHEFCMEVVRRSFLK